MRTDYVIAIIDGKVERESKSIKQLLEEFNEGQDVTIVEILEKPIIPKLLEYCEFTAEPKELGQMVKVREKKNQILKSTTNYVEPYIPKRRYYRRGNIKR